MGKKSNTIRFRVTDEELNSIKKINPSASNFSDLLRSIILKEAKNHCSEEQRKLNNYNDKLNDLNEKIFSLENERDVVEGLILKLTSNMNSKEESK